MLKIVCRIIELIEQNIRENKKRKMVQMLRGKRDTIWLRGQRQ